MKNLQDAKEYLHRWKKQGNVGTLFFYSWPRSDGFEIIEERVIKTREMDKDTAAAFIFLMESLGIEKGEMRRDKDGKPDRIKFTRRVDDQD